MGGAALSIVSALLEVEEYESQVDGDVQRASDKTLPNPMHLLVGKGTNDRASRTNVERHAAGHDCGNDSNAWHI